MLTHNDWEIVHHDVSLVLASDACVGVLAHNDWETTPCDVIMPALCETGMYTLMQA